MLIDSVAHNPRVETDPACGRATHPQQRKMQRNVCAMTWAEIVLQIAVAGLSAFGGAFAAFLLERRRDRETQVDERYLQARFAHLLILEQCQELMVLEQESLEPFRGRDDAWRMLPPSISRSIATSLNVKDLAFMLEGSDPDLLNRLIVGQQQYNTVRKVVELREKAHSDMQSRVATLVAQGGEGADSEDRMNRAVGLDVVGRLQSLTGALFEMNPSALDLLKRNLEDLAVFIRKTFPKKREPKVEFTQQDGRL